MAIRFPRAHALLLAGLMGSATSIAAGQALSLQERKIVDFANTQTAEAVGLLEKVVNMPSPTSDQAGVRAVGGVFLRELEALGFDTTWIPLPDSLHRAGHLMARRSGKGGKKILLLGHLDTVPEGKAFRRSGSTGYGSGVYDMKGGIVILLYALKALFAVGALDRGSVTVVLSGDGENPASPSSVSRELMTDAATASDYVLSFEGLSDGTLVTSRRGTIWWRLETTGRSGHSGGIFSDSGGSGAIFEAARILDAFRDGLRFDSMVTVNPSVIVGGTGVTYNPVQETGTATGTHNVVPRSVVVEGDLRYLNSAQKDEACDSMRAIVARHFPQTGGAISFREGGPPMAASRGSEQLAEQYQRLSMLLGYGRVVPRSPDRGGAGDVSFVSGIVPALDGLGPEGGHSHSPDEYVDLDSFPMQITRAALIISRLSR